MKANVGRGSGFRGALDYAMGEEKDAELVGGNLSGTTPREMAAEFGISRNLRPNCKKPVWHCSLSLPPGDRLDSDRWEAITKDFMEQMGMDPDNHQYVAIRHNDTDKDHVHIIASRVGLDGSLWYGQKDVFKAIGATQELEKKHDLTLTPGLNGVQAERGLSKNEIEKTLRTGDAPTRAKLQEIISAATAKESHIFDFMDDLESQGVKVIPAMSHTTGRLNGLAYEMDGLKFSGRKLGGNYTWKNLQEVINYDQDRDSKELSARANQAKVSQLDISSRAKGHAHRSDNERTYDDANSNGRNERKENPNDRAVIQGHGHDSNIDEPHELPQRETGGLFGKSDAARANNEKHGKDLPEENQPTFSAGRADAWIGAKRDVATIVAGIGGRTFSNRGVVEERAIREKAWNNQASHFHATGYLVHAEKNGESNLLNRTEYDIPVPFTSKGVELNMNDLMAKNGIGHNIKITPHVSGGEKSFNNDTNFRSLRNVSQSNLERMISDGIKPNLTISTGDTYEVGFKMPNYEIPKIGQPTLTAQYNGRERAMSQISNKYADGQVYRDITLVGSKVHGTDGNYAMERREYSDKEVSPALANTVDVHSRRVEMEIRLENIKTRENSPEGAIEQNYESSITGENKREGNNNTKDFNTCLNIISTHARKAITHLGEFNAYFKSQLDKAFEKFSPSLFDKRRTVKQAKAHRDKIEHEALEAYLSGSGSGGGGGKPQAQEVLKELKEKHEKEQAQKQRLGNQEQDQGLKR